jgi:DNA mismatch endonuclease (patch repair protein)
MTDVLTRKQRSVTMAAVRGKNTTPEMFVRRLVHSLGFRYGLHTNSLPGKPDLVFRSRRKVIFVHGCFWHMHSCKHGRNAPVSNVEYWGRKRAGNFQRDREHVKALKKAGWRVLVIWECGLKDERRLRNRLLAFLAQQ